tara:strand:+ start:5196 stop:6515 length:1320 start_codon:yes stop_codon:yes gene_type:complete
MLFHNPSFLFIFLPIVFFAYFVFTKKIRFWLLIVSGFIFYAAWNIKLSPLILFSIIINFFVCRFLIKNHNKVVKKRILVASIIFNITYLGIFKYADFFILNINTLINTNFELWKLPFPLALSFVTFQTIAFICDCYEDDIKDFSFKKYALFIIFFPQLIAGPIVKFNMMINQFESDKNEIINFKNIIIGLIVLSIGIIKKVFIADNLSIFSDQLFALNDNLNFFETWIGTFCFTFQIYFDFSGYIDMATGIALLFNIRLPLNFNSPYKATGIIDFWQRWHITLTSFLTNYIYTPILRSFKNLNFFKSMIATLIVFLIAGLWHGPSWLFVIFGAIHGIGLIINHIYRRFFKFEINTVISRVLTFLYINFSFVFFRSESLDDAFIILERMMGIGLFKNIEYFKLDMTHNTLVAFSASLLICFFLKNTNWLIEKLKLSKVLD